MYHKVKDKYIVAISKVRCGMPLCNDDNNGDTMMVVMYCSCTISKANTSSSRRFHNS